MIAKLLASMLPLVAPPAAAPASPMVEQLDGTAFYALESPSFQKLTPQERLLAYWLSQAAIAVDPIIYDQMSTTGLEQKKLIGALIEKPERLPADTRAAILQYAKLFFANKGNHNEYTNQKFIPTVTFDQFKTAAFAAKKAGATLPERTALSTLLTKLKPSLFDINFETVTTAKTPPAGKDILTASATNFYGHDVALADLKGFAEKNAINSKVVKQDGKLVEQVYRCGTPDGKVPAGLYAKELGQAVVALTQARAYAEPAQAAVIDALIKYYQTGDLADQRDFNIKWVQNDAKVDFVNGFIETYRDARAAKGAAEALVSVRDLSLNELMQKLAANALYFEKKAPWLDKFRKLDVKPPTGKAVEVLVETGDFSVSIIGDNLPNEEDIHAQYGSKNFLMTNASAVFAQARDALVVREFDPDDTAQSDKVGIFTDNMLTAMHEIIGHGSGLVLDKREPRETLRENYSALEEARADLMAYWNVTDAAKLKELGVEDADAVAREMYESLARSIFGVLNHYPKGEQAEEDHDRDRLLIWNYVAQKGGVGLTEKGGKHYAKVLDLKKARAAVGELLAELMRIKSEGDGAAIEKLIQTYGLKFDGKLRDEVVARYKALQLPPYRAGIYGTMELVKGADGKATDAKIVYARDFLGQQLEWARTTQTLGF